MQNQITSNVQPVQQTEQSEINPKLQSREKKRKSFLAFGILNIFGSIFLYFG